MCTFIDCGADTYSCISCMGILTYRGICNLKPDGESSITRTSADAHFKLVSSSTLNMLVLRSHSHKQEQVGNFPVRRLALDLRGSKRDHRAPIRFTIRFDPLQLNRILRLQDGTTHKSTH